MLSLKKSFFLLKRLWAMISSRRKNRIYLIIILSLVAVLAEVISIGSIIPFIAVILDPTSALDFPFLKNFISPQYYNDFSDLIVVTGIFFIAAILCAGIVRFALLYFQVKTGHQIGLDINKAIYKNVIYRSFEDHINSNSSDTITYITMRVNQVVSSAILPAMVMISSTLLISAIIIFLLIYSTGVSMFLLGSFAVIYSLIIRYSNKKLLLNSKLINNNTQKIIRNVQESLGSFRDIVLQRNQEYHVKIFTDNDKALRSAYFTNSILSSAPRYIIESLGMFLLVIATLFLSRFSENSEDFLPLLGALAISAQRLMPLLQQAYSAWATVQGNQEVLKTTVEMLEVAKQITPIDNIVIDKPLKLYKKIKFERVSFKYRDSKDYVFKDLTFEINFGKVTGILGRTGTGKSTLLDLLMGLLQPTKGSVKLDGRLISENSKLGLLKNISYIPQENFLIDSTIRENIAFGLSQDLINEKLLIHAAKQAAIHEMIVSLPLGYDTKVGERGSKLSGGQVQRIVLARALYRKPKILVLDEATSALDINTEREILTEINKIKSGMSIIMVTHRESNLFLCDDIYKLNQNKIIKV